VPKYFPSASHAVVRTVADQKTMDKMKGTMAFVDVYMGPGENAICYIAIKKISGPTLGVNAYIPKTPIYVGDKLTYIPVIQGEPADELKFFALKAFDRVRSVYGLKFGKSYKVLAKTVEEIGATNAVNLPGLGAGTVR
jgi:hypothetical protein